MIGSLFEHTTVPVVEQVVAFTQARQNVLAGNIANADTPGYRARDLSPAVFRERLREAIAVRNAGPGASSERRTTAAEAALAEVRQSFDTILQHDDTNVSLEEQVNELNKNLAEHNLAIAVLRSQFALLQAAISQRA
jgi:flagellar basal-body rod protein FlgB